MDRLTEFDGIPIDRLRELATADKDRRVVVLPCKVGDAAYFIHDGEIRLFTVIHIQVATDGEIYIKAECPAFGSIDCPVFDFCVGGDCCAFWFSTQSIAAREIFFTREEAEAALKEGKADG